MIHQLRPLSFKDLDSACRRLLHFHAADRRMQALAISCILLFCAGPLKRTEIDVLVSDRPLVCALNMHDCVATLH